MSKVLVNESSLTGIANAIRGKNGSTTTYKPSEMAAAITAISGGAEPVIEALSVTSNGTYTAPDGVDGYSPVTVNVPQDGGPPESAFVISGDCSYRFANGGWDWFIENYGNKVTTKYINNAPNMFKSSSVESIPFDINCSNYSYYDYINMFKNCTKLKEIGTIRNLYPVSMQYLFGSCNNLRQLPIFENLNMSRIYNYQYSNIGYLFYECYSLRNIPEELLNVIYQTKTTSSTAAYTQFNNEFFGCLSLDEVKGLNPQTGNLTSNCFNSTFYNCYRLKNAIFALQEDGTPYVVNWKSQVIGFTNNVGYAESTSSIINYNSGITADKQVTDATTYAALKNDPDWFTTDVAYSRYNHDSAVATINSLPDTSAYLASKGGTNTIKFEGAAGSATDGGAISSLTTEEIAVATARGWTVSIV